MDLNYSESEMAFRDEVRDWLAQKGPAVLNVLTRTELVSAFAPVEQIRGMHITYKAFFPVL